MNLNFSRKPEYQLNTNLIDEMIKLYGTPVKFVLMDKIQDFGPHTNNKPENSIFNDFKALKTQEVLIEKEIFILINDSEGYPNGLNFMFGQFGLHNEDTLQCFVSLKSLDFLSTKENDEKIVNPKEVISNIIIFPNEKAMEITDCQIHVPGVNNKFVYSDVPSCYQLSLKSHNFDRSAVSKAIIDQGSLKMAKSSESLDKFLALSQNIKEFATQEELTTENFQDVRKSNKIDDVFGSS